MDYRPLMDTISGPLSLGIRLGLSVDKRVGIFSATWLFVQSLRMDMSEEMALKGICGGAVLCGVGFIMALFIADLPFRAPALQENARMSILIASLLSGVIGLIVLMIGRVDPEIEYKG
jgi:NhaA family Na+:H+ antiporter